MPEPKQKKLTIKEAKLVKNVALGKTKRESAQLAGYSGSPETLSVTASEVLKKPKVQDALQVELEKQGIGIEQIIAPVTKALNAKVKFRTEAGSIETDEDDLEMQLKGHDRAMKIVTLGQKQDNQFNADNINIIQVQQQDKDKYGL